MKKKMLVLTRPKLSLDHCACSVLMDKTYTMLLVEGCILKLIIMFKFTLNIAL